MSIYYLYGIRYFRYFENGEELVASKPIRLIKAQPEDTYYDLSATERIGVNHLREEQVYGALKEILSSDRTTERVIGVNLHKPPQLPEYEQRLDSGKIVVMVHRFTISDPRIETQVMKALKGE